MKDLKISTELISSVLVKETRHLTYDTIYVEDNYIIFSYEGEYQFEVNIYEFAFKCKEWAFKRELNLWTDYLGNCQIQDKEFQLLHDCYSDTEIETIIKVCEWLLSEVNK